ncbi:hypothetical protein Y032_0004g1953 [Ancylostoma ceylanicum]|uniref:Uncharacterized protein n=1 Tax=Ancylostoma ceylanicum TaxID=53326 RepID=A0A016VUN6_9BILA|nr:hypothetical protein Y032_0004g1953 [Ancylostoma ceylanicum]
MLTTDYQSGILTFPIKESIRDSLAVITAKLVKKMDPVDGLTPYEINGTRILKSTDLTTFSKIVYTKEGTELFPGKLNPGNNLVYRSRYLLEGMIRLGVAIDERLLKKLFQAFSKGTNQSSTVVNF